MTPSLLRQFWKFVECTQAAILLNLDDASLSQWLLAQFNHQQHLEGYQLDHLNSYIDTRLSLIRDMASDRYSDFLNPERLSCPVQCSSEEQQWYSRALG
ncbi:hypothetical protein L3556_10855 [Candidatus Synechococcus calcipolaris G9]|uniref:Nitrogenase-stabilizing/protective protein NifW n=1 Tax=Candidatus Synechococcus calcipolaris G9 TaxID=1497997 RepID=A0ABT6F0S0_9SYNE|nr:hypothetical protein [Candidatus Synechococcus calcipolaris]MDG2991424.1 hypothetical protein [Candidatus Synechococcus calcipolaris G9]